MKRLMIVAALGAASTVLAGCADFKATDKILRNDHRVIQNTRVVQQPAVVRVQQPTVQTVVRQQQQVAPIIVQQQQQQQPRQVIIQQQPVITTARTVVTQPTTTTVVTQPQVVRISTLTRPQILMVQRALATRGLYRAPIDGIFGIQTAQAMAKYQRSIGETGPVTMTILEGLGVSLRS